MGFPQDSPGHFKTTLRKNILTENPHSLQGQSSPTISVGLNLDIPVNDLLSALLSYQLPGLWEGTGWDR